MWKVVYIAQNAHSADKIKQLLTENGFLIQMKSVGGRHKDSYEISVPFSEAEDAYEVLCEHRFQC